ncbi:MAG: tRNA lysidine(34) synthetase TilS [Anaeromyxobacter sp.]
MRTPTLGPYPAAVLATLRRRRLAGPGQGVLVALSGGADSTALLAALAALRDAGELGALRALHVDHGLRPAAADRAAAEAACARLGVPLEVIAVRVAPGNVQAQARRARYAALREAALRHGLARIATGHTRSDQAETVLLRLLRGAGARGLAGIPPRRGAIIRPLIDRSRAEGLAWLQSLGLGWCEDPSNATPRFARNRLRQRLLPLLAELAPAHERALARAANLLRDDERALARAGRVAGGAVAVEAVRAQPVAVRRRTVRALWRRARRGGELSAEHVERVLRLLRSRRPRALALPGGVVARCRYGLLELAPEAPGAAPLPPTGVPGPGRYPLAGRGEVARVQAEHPDRVAWPLELRSRRPGDRIRPEGGNGSKPLKAWLIDRKVPRERRDGLVLLTCGAEVLAIPELGVRGVAGAAGGLEVRLEPAEGR